jgi:hypothetical protein
MNIKDIEDKIIARLKEEIPEVLIRPFPDKPSEFILLHPLGAILIHYQGANYSTTQSLGFVNQIKTAEFSITIVTRNLRSNEGAYELLDTVRLALTGYEIEGCSELTPIKENFISETKGIWQYAINFSLSVPCIQIY